MQFQVPQFIEVEDKIVGPLTFKQFVFVAGGLGFAYVLWRVLPLFAAAPLIVGVLGLAAALAFMQVNGRPFLLALENAFYYVLHPKLYLWNNERSKRPQVKRAAEPSRGSASVYVPKLSDSKLHELAWSLDINERIAAGTTDDRDRGSVDSMRGLRVPEDVVTQLRKSAPLQ
jgi:hypothetical protein